MKKSKAKAVYSYLPIYDRHVFYGNDLEKIKAEILKYFKPNEVDLEILNESNIHGLTAPIFHPDNDEAVMAHVMCILEVGSIGTVTHEATHLTNQIFCYLGQELDNINDEAQAYLNGYLAQQFMELVRGHKKQSHERKPRK